MLLLDFKIGCSTKCNNFFKNIELVYVGNILVGVEGKTKHQIRVIWVLQNQIPINNAPNMHYGSCKLIQVI